MTGRIFRSTLAASLTVLLASLLVITGCLYSYFGTVQERQLREELSFAAAAVEADGDDYLARLRSTASRLTWVAADGTVLYDTQADAAAMENHAGRQEIREALTGGSGSSVRYSSTLTEKTVYQAMRLTDGSVLRISGSQKTAWMLVLGMLHAVIVVVLLALVVASYRQVVHAYPGGGGSYEVVSTNLGPRAGLGRADLSGIGQIAEREHAHQVAQTGHDVFRRLTESTIPTFAFVNGAALGGGLELALSCHYRTVSEGVGAVAFPECFLGLFPGWGGTQLLPNLIGADAAVSVIIENALNQNKMLNAKKAAQLGIFDELLESADFLEESVRWAVRVVNGEHTVQRPE